MNKPLKGEQVTMKSVTAITGVRSLTPLKIGLLSILGICIAAVALATPAFNVLSNVMSRATVGPFHVEAESENSPWEVQLDTSGVSDIITQTVTFGPGGYSGWHSHPGPVFVSVKSGTLTFYVATDPSCMPHVFPAGTGFVDRGSDPHFARNEGTENLTINATYIVPPGAPRRIEQPRPGNCPF